jgi:hypothetical protein
MCNRNNKRRNIRKVTLIAIDCVEELKLNHMAIVAVKVGTKRTTDEKNDLQYNTERPPSVALTS